jgi:hypothetical protein
LPLFRYGIRQVQTRKRNTQHHHNQTDTRNSAAGCSASLDALAAYEEQRQTEKYGETRDR